MELPLSIKTSYTLQFEHTGQKWSVPDDCIKMIDGKAWLRVSGTKYGFVKLAMGDAMPGKNPSLASFPPWKNLLQQRNDKSQQAPSTSDLFGDEAEGGQVNKKRKRKPPATQDGDSGCIELDLGGTHGLLIARKASKSNEDLVVQLEAGQVGKLCQYLHESSKDVGFEPSRSYKRSGKFEGVAKKRRKADGLEVADQAEDQDLKEQDVQD